jgi:diguanylate cyclase (GGDEF)-like protein/PAS domain S-box-containing protein
MVALLGALAVIGSRSVHEVRRRHPGWPGWVLSAAALGALIVREVASRIAGGATHPGPLVAGVIAGVAAASALALLSPPGIAPAQRIRESVEGLLITGACAIVLWVSALGDTVLRSPLTSLDRALVAVTPLGMGFIAASALLVLLRTPRSNRASLGWYTLGVGGLVVAEVLALPAVLAGAAPPDMPTGIAVVVAAAAIAIAATHPTTLPSPRLHGTENRFAWTLFIVPSSAALAFAIPRLRPGIADPPLLGISTVVIAIHLIHQTLTIVENRHLVANLDRRVEDRTDELARRERYYRNLFEHSADIVAVVGADLRFRHHTRSLTTVLGWQPEELDGVRVDDLFVGLEATQALEATQHVFDRGYPTATANDRLLHVDGSWRDVEMHFANHLDDPAVQGVVITTRDVSTRRRLEEELLRQAFHDPLTGLANRTLFRSTVERAIAIARSLQHIVSVLLLDLDGFKGVNDSFGHPAGDGLLATFAERVGAVMRVEDTFARLGGDEFAVLVDANGNPDAVATAIRAQLRDPFTVEGRMIHLSASIGIADSHDARDVDTLLRNADVAMYVAKRDRARSAVRFQQSMHDASVDRLQTLTDLRRAIDNDQLRVWLQPVVELASGSTVGYEALLRWEHPVEGLVPPTKFIGLAEESGLIEPIGRFVLSSALAMLADHGIAHDAFVSVNISGRQFDDPHLADTVEDALRATGIEPRRLVLEITESTVMRDITAARIQLDRLVGLGVRIALDDFGTGYSSLAALSQFPLHVLKVDRSFVAALGEDRSSASALLAAIEEIGRALGLRLVAEGVETPLERGALLDLGFTYAQGYLFLPPRPAPEAVAASHEPLGSSSSIDGATVSRWA